jgi:hypothetical protein
MRKERREMSERISPSTILLILVLASVYCLLPMVYARWLRHWRHNLLLKAFGCVVSLGLLALVLIAEFFLGKTNLTPKPMDDPFFSTVIIAENVVALAIFFWILSRRSPPRGVG